MISFETIGGTAKAGTLYGIGAGPGDVRYLTLRAASLIRAVDVVAYFAKRGREGNARRTVAPLLDGAREEVRLEYPLTDELPVTHPDYRREIAEFYAQAADMLARHLGAGRSVGLLSEGDPFFFGSFMHMWRRLEADFPVEVVPGVSGMSGCWTRANAPITWGDDVLTVLTGTLEEAELARRLRGTDAAVIMKVGRNLGKVRRAVEAAGCLARAILVERGTMAGERVVPLSECSGASGHYFSIVLVPGQGRRL
jgi:precorrin-2/cobalt-factor-2 C20-methyltransferase